MRALHWTVTSLGRGLEGIWGTDIGEGEGNNGAEWTRDCRSDAGERLGLGFVDGFGSVEPVTGAEEFFVEVGFEGNTGSGAKPSTDSGTLVTVCSHNAPFILGEACTFREPLVTTEGSGIVNDIAPRRLFIRNRWSF